MTDEATIRDRALGAYLGLAVGDALGATVEFMTRDEIRARYGSRGGWLGSGGPGGRHDCITGGGWLNLRPGQVTDDTEMSLALGAAILADPGWDTARVARHFAAWLKTGPLDCGATCRRGIRRFMVEGTIAGPVNEGDAGNGALMRNLPVALSTLGRPETFREQSLAQARITHNNPLSDAATLTLGAMVQHLIMGGDMAGCRTLADDLVARHRLFRFVPYPGRASAYVVDTVQTVLHFFFATDDAESCVVETVNQGDDADTTGALAGMLAGARFGAAAIPSRWRDRLDPQVRAEVEDQALALMERALARL